MTATQRLLEMGLSLPPAPVKGGVYQSVKPFGHNLFYVSGCGPNQPGQQFAGKLGRDYTLAEGQQAARCAMLNFLAAVEDRIGSLDRVKSIVKVLVLVSGTDEFYEQPQVANGATQLLVELFGEQAGAPSRSAIGVNALPGNIPVEIEGIVEVFEE